jgi:LPXTG-motif cell wall-anchored protein
MKKIRKKAKKVAAKSIHLFGVILMLVQTIGMPLSAGVLLTPTTAIAQEEGTSSDSGNASSGTTVSDPAPKTDTKDVVKEEPKSDPAPVVDPKPIPTLPSDPTPAPAVTDTTTSETDNNNVDNGSAAGSGIIDPEAAFTEKLTQTTGTQPVTTLVLDNVPVAEKTCLADGASIKTSDANDWDVTGDIAKTRNDVKLGVKYEFPGNKDVSITFTCLPTDPAKLSTLKIEQIKSSDINLPEGVSAATDYAYDVTTTMKDGDFKYDLTLPKSDKANADINYIEKTAEEAKNQDITVSDLKLVDDTKIKTETNDVKVTELDHFTIFIATYADFGLTTSETTYLQGDIVYTNSTSLTSNKYYKVDIIEQNGTTRHSAAACTTGVTSLEGSYLLSTTAPVGTNWKAEITKYDSLVNCNAGSSKTDTGTATFAVTAYNTSTANPTISQSCGLDIALVIDNSNSIDSTELGQMKTALTGFVNALSGTPTQFSVTRFGTNASVVQTFTSNTTDVNNAINGVSTGGGGTNWKEGIASARGTFDPRTSKPNLMIFASDGNPTFPDCGGSSTCAADVNSAIAEANTAKSSPLNIRILALGIGDGLLVENLKAISGHVVNAPSILGSDVITTDFSGMATQLSNFAKQTCGGTITVNKYYDDTSHRGGTGWTFDVAGSSKTTDNNGQTNAVDVSAGNTVSVTETGLLSGYSFGSASCKKSTGASVGTPDSANKKVTGITVGGDDIISCDFINTTNKGSITIIKDAVPNDSQDFAFTTAGTGLSSFSLDDDSDGTLSNTKNFNNLMPGAFSVTEGTTSGWTLSNISCDSGGSVDLANRKASITITPGANVTCTFTNTKQTGTLTVNKILSPSSDAGKFNLQIDGISKVTNIGDGGSTGSQTLSVGSHTISETAGTGTSLSDYTSVIGGACDSNGNVNLAAGDNKTCTITNTRKTGHIIVDKVTNPSADPTSFSFTTTGSGYSSFNLTDAAAPNNQTLNTGTYSVAETAKTGWDQTSATCVSSIGDTETIGSLKLDSNETITCTFTNTKQNPVINVVKSSTTTSVTTAGQVVPYKFVVTNIGNMTLTGITVTDPKCTSAITGPSGDTNTDSKLQTTETWTYTCNHTVTQAEIDGGGNLSNTVTADSVESAPDTDSLNIPITQDASISVEKTSTTTTLSAPQTVTYSYVVTNIGNVTLTGISLSDDNDNDDMNCPATTLAVTANMTCTATHTFTQAELDAGGSLDNTVTASSSEAPDATDDLSIPITRGKIIVEKQTLPNGETQSFEFDPSWSGNNFNLTDGQQSGSGWMAPGAYSVAEMVPTGWDLINITCTDPNQNSGQNPTGAAAGALISLEDGETVTCIFTNTKLPTLTVNKVLYPVGHGAFDLKIDGTVYANNVGDGGSTGARIVSVGNHQVSEQVGNPSTVMGDYDVTYGDDCDADGGITLAAGDNKTCTITNTAYGSLTINKDAIPNDSQDFSFTTTGAGLSDFSLDDDSDPALSNTQPFYHLIPGTYSVSENSVSGWDLTNVTCSDGSDPSSIDISAGENVTCTFTNTKRGKIIVDKVTNPSGDPQSFDFALMGGPSSLNQSFALSDSDTPFDSGLIAPGTSYTVAEQNIPDNWIYYTSPCYDNDGVYYDNAAFTVEPGKTVTCTFTNIKKGSIKIQKNTTGGDGTFNFTSNFGVSSLTTSSGASSQTVDDLNPSIYPGASYSISETVPTGWDQDSATCDHGTIENIEVLPGQTTTCTFTNTKRGHIIVDKITNPSGESQNFDFSVSGDGYNNFSLTDVTEPNDQELVPGSYSVSENVPGGWNQANVRCESSIGDNESADALELDPNETITCAFTNAKNGHLIIQKTTVPSGDPTNFDIHIADTFPALTDNQKSAAHYCEWLTSSDEYVYVTFPGNDPKLWTVGGQWLVVASEQTGNNLWQIWDGTQWQNAGWNNYYIAHSALSDNLRCNFDSVTYSGQGGFYASNSYSDVSSLSDPQTIGVPAFIGDTSGSISDSQDKNYELAPGTYSVSENGVDGWGITGNTCTDVVVSPGETAYCTITNTRDTGSITVNKIIDVDGDLATTNDQTPGVNWQFDVNGEAGADTSNPDPASTDLNGAVTFASLKTGQYDITETVQPGYDLVGASCGVENGNLDGNTLYSTTVAKDQNIVCTFYNTPNGTIHGYKWDDANGNREQDCSLINDQQVCEQKLSRWTINLYKSNGEGYDLINSMLTDEGTEHFGWYWFEHLFPGDYKVCEALENGWTPTYPFTDKDDNCHLVTLPDDNSNGFNESANAVEGPEYNFGNQFVAPQLRIEKYVGTEDNFSLTGQHPGDTVHYILKIKAQGVDEKGEIIIPNTSDVNDIHVTDLPPSGFTYVSGSASAVSDNPSHAGPLELSHIYASPGVWDLGTMIPGEVIMLEYDAVISADQVAGNYPDLAWASGIDLLENTVQATKGDPELFAGTEVAIIVPGQNNVSLVEKTETDTNTKHKTRRVLGASTSLPATGSSTFWIILAMLLAFVGGGLIFLGRKKKNQANSSINTVMKIFILALSATALFGLSPIVKAASPDPNISVKIETPVSPTDSGIFKIGFVALDIKGRNLAAECYKVPSDIIPNDYVVKAGGNSGNCLVDLPDGTYQFFVRAYDSSDSSSYSESTTVTVEINSAIPGAPLNYDRPGDGCTVNFTTANDGLTAGVELYRSTSLDFIADPSTFVGSVLVLPNTSGSIMDTNGDCGGSYYYAIRAISASGAGSDFVGDEKVTVHHRTRTVTRTVRTGGGTTTTGAIPVTGGGGTVAGQQTGEGEQQQGNVQGENVEQGQVGGAETGQENVAGAEDWQSKLKKNWPWILGGLIVLGYIYYVARKRKKSGRKPNFPNEPGPSGDITV